MRSFTKSANGYILEVAPSQARDIYDLLEQENIPYQIKPINSEFDGSPMIQYFFQDLPEWLLADWVRSFPIHGF